MCNNDPSNVRSAERLKGRQYLVGLPLLAAAGTLSTFRPSSQWTKAPRPFSHLIPAPSMPNIRSSTRETLGLPRRYIDVIIDVPLFLINHGKLAGQIIIRFLSK